MSINSNLLHVIGWFNKKPSINHGWLKITAQTGKRYETWPHHTYAINREFSIIGFTKAVLPVSIVGPFLDILNILYFWGIFVWLRREKRRHLDKQPSTKSSFWIANFLPRHCRAGRHEWHVVASAGGHRCRRLRHYHVVIFVGYKQQFCTIREGLDDYGTWKY